MSTISFRGVAAGFAICLLFIAFVSVYVNLFGNEASVLIYYVSLVSWIFPGYVAGAVAREKGALNGAAVGCLVGILFGAVAFLFDDAPVGVESANGLEVAVVVGGLGALLCGLGGLIWDLRERPNSR